jgi:predicted NAD-dependent protein-ADP-ribosyltransferase YbiA (DUF1768 family)
MEIKSGGGYPASSLSNFARHPFTIDGITCNSMEGFLQSLKFKNQDMQLYVCSLSGMAAKVKGRNKRWKKHQTLYWLGMPIKRSSLEYQILLDMAFDCLSTNDSFSKALLSTGECSFTHSIGKNKIQETVLTVNEFCSRLYRIRDRLRGGLK